MADRTEQQVRERVWVEKFDHEASDTPQLVERLFVETYRRVMPDGTVQIVRDGTIEILTPRSTQDPS